MVTLLTPVQAAEYANVSRETIRAAVETGRLKVMQYGCGSVRPRYKIAIEAIEKWMNEAAFTTYTKPGTVRKEKPKKATAPAGMEIGKDGKLRITRKRD